MANIFNNTDNLYWVYTTYGKERLTSLQQNDILRLYNVRIGSYDWYEDPQKLLGNSYSETAFKAYFQDGTEKSLGSEIENCVLPITNKELNEDEMCVTLITSIDENTGGFDIREVGIYETTDNGTEKLFAVCTMQALPKPSSETNHFISTQFNCMLYSRLLAENFDKILLDPNNNYATAEEIRAYQQTLLFVESNLSEQISRNTQLIGYNRPEQLYNLILEDKKKYASFGISATYANFLSATELSNVASFWVFSPTNDTTRRVSIADLSIHGINLATDQVSTAYEQGYEGLVSWLNFDQKHYYMLDSDVNFSLLENGEDTPFTLFFIGAQNKNTHNCTIIAKDNDFAEHPGFYVKILEDRRVQVRFYSNASNYVTFTTSPKAVPAAGTFYVLSVTYNADVKENNPMVSIAVNGVGQAVSVERSKNEQDSVYKYTGMTEAGMNMPMFSFIRSQDGDKEFIDSKVCLITLVKDRLTEEYIKAASYNMTALIGKDPCLA